MKDFKPRVGQIAHFKPRRIEKVVYQGTSGGGK